MSARFCSCPRRRTRTAWWPSNWRPARCFCSTESSRSSSPKRWWWLFALSGLIGLLCMGMAYPISTNIGVDESEV